MSEITHQSSEEKSSTHSKEKEVNLSQNNKALEKISYKDVDLSYSSIEEMMRENAKLKHKYENVKRELEVYKNRDSFKSRLSDVEKARHSLENLKLQVLLHDLTEENIDLKDELN